MGKGGTIDIIAGLVALTNGAQLNASTDGGGNAGNVTINARDTLELNNSSISTNAVSVGGGDITITAKDIRLRNNSLIRTDLSRSQGSGGNITLNANTILALENSDILAFAPQGKGGNITFNTRVFFSDPLYRPSATTTDPVTFESLRNNGRVDVNASGAVSGTISGVPDSSFIQNSLTELPQNLIDPNVLIANSCIVRSRKRQQGTFTITGAGGLPNRPGDVSVSSYPTGEVRSISGRDKGYRVSASRPWHKGDPIVEPQGVYQLPSGHLVLSRECNN